MTEHFPVSVTGRRGNTKSLIARERMRNLSWLAKNRHQTWKCYKVGIITETVYWDRMRTLKWLESLL